MGMLAMAMLGTNNTAYLADLNTYATLIAKSTQGKVYAKKDICGKDSANNDYCYALTSAGTWVGAKDETTIGSRYWGYAGTASYLLQSGKVEFKENSFLMDSTLVNNVCVTDVSGGQCTGNAKTATPGTYKFSLYAYTDGDDYATIVQASGFTHLAIRQWVSVEKMGGDKAENIVTINGGYRLSNISSNDVQNITIKGEKTSLTHKFEKKANIGTITNSVPVPAKTVDVRIHVVPNDDKSFYVDYVFPLTDGL